MRCGQSLPADSYSTIYFAVFMQQRLLKLFIEKPLITSLLQNKIYILLILHLIKSVKTWKYNN